MVKWYFGCILKSIIYIAVSSMESSVRVVFLGADCMVTDCKRIHKQRLHYFSGLNLFWKVLLFLFFCWGSYCYLISCCNAFLCYCKHLCRLRGGVLRVKI